MSESCALWLLRRDWSSGFVANDAMNAFCGARNGDAEFVDQIAVFDEDAEDKPCCENNVSVAPQ